MFDGVGVRQLDFISDLEISMDSYSERKFRNDTDNLPAYLFMSVISLEWKWISEKRPQR